MVYPSSSHEPETAMSAGQPWTSWAAEMGAPEISRSVKDWDGERYNIAYLAYCCSVFSRA